MRAPLLCILPSTAQSTAAAMRFGRVFENGRYRASRAKNYLHLNGRNANPLSFSLASTVCLSGVRQSD